MEQYRRIAAADVEAFADAVRSHWSHLEQMPHPSEAETEAEFIFPILNCLGWEYLPQQEPGRGRHDIADALLFIDAERKARARPLPAVDRFRLGAVVVENEARDTARSGSRLSRSPFVADPALSRPRRTAVERSRALGPFDQRAILAALLGTGPRSGGRICRNRSAGACRRPPATGTGWSRRPALAARVHAVVRAQRPRSRRSPRRDIS